jgi:hypothetical protein
MAKRVETLVIPDMDDCRISVTFLNCREMTIIIRDRIRDMIKKGNEAWSRSKAARPTRDYDPLYGSCARVDSRYVFVEAVL